jgi:transcriptional regulator with XRE-family HTH domain
VSLMLGRSQSSLAKIEQSGRITFCLLERLAAIYNKPISYFQTISAEIRQGSSYLGMSNEEWAIEASRLRGRPALRAMKKRWKQYPTVVISAPHKPRNKSGKTEDGE